MQRPATWKFLALGAAVTGLSFIGAGAALADDAVTDINRETISTADDGDEDSSRILGLIPR